MQVLEISNRGRLLAPPVDKKLVTTLNADIYRIVRSDPTLKEIIYRNYVCIDGRPIHALSKRYANDTELVQGSTLIFDLAKYSASSGSPMLIIGGRQDVNDAAVENLRVEHNCEVYGYAPEQVDEAALQKCCAMIVQHNIKFVFVCLGAPRQEIAAARMIAMLPDEHSALFIGAGGSVDFAAKAISRAPRVMQAMCLEGVYRLFKEPNYKRIRRLITSLWGLGLFYFDVMTKKLVICSHR